MAEQRKSILQMRLPTPRKKDMNTFKFQPALDKTSMKYLKKRLIKPYLLWKIEERHCSDSKPCFHTISIEFVEFNLINCIF